MTAATVLAILVAAGEAQAPATIGMATAAADVIGEPDSVRVVEAGAISDAEVLRAEEVHVALAVVALTWKDANHLHADLRLHAARTDRWIDREVDFVAADTPAERGRALGFAMASMLPAGDPTLPLATRAARLPEAPPLTVGSNAFEASFLAAAGLDGPAGAFGARLAFERFVTPGASLGVSLSGRDGRIVALDAQEVTASAGLGAALWPVTPTRDGRLGLAVRGEALLIYEAVVHTDAAGARTWKGHALPGASLGLEGTWSLSGAFELCVGGGAELAAGSVDVTVIAGPPMGGTARIPLVRAWVEAGARVRF